MKFWDASALVPLLIDEPPTRTLQAITERDRAMLVWWGTRVECVSAVARLERQGGLAASAIDRAFERLRGLIAGWDEVEGTEALRDVAQRFLRVHPLRAADALQLAAAYVGSDRRPTSFEFVTLDERLAEAARKEGFSVVEIAVE
jgi:predicted nucleic acid-binding protein